MKFIKALVLVLTVWSLGLFAIPPAQAGSSTNTGSMSHPHESYAGWGFDSVLLSNGKVLLVGGSDFNASTDAGFLPVPELYDPATGMWTTKPMVMNNHRIRFTTTTLLNGKVLVVGGYDNDNNSQADTELFDPATGIWTNTAAVNFGREDHTATLLPDGEVLAIGGRDIYGISTKSVELYNPTTGTWTTNGLLNTARYSHTATLLANGKVLVAGGDSYAGGPDPVPLTSAEIYDPGTGTSTPIVLNNAVKLSSGAFQIGFSNAPGASFTALATTNLSLPVSNWTTLGSIPEISSGQYQFTDTQATNKPQRFYRVSSP